MADHLTIERVQPRRMWFLRWLVKHRYSYFDLIVVGLAAGAIQRSDWGLAVGMLLVGAFVSVCLELASEARP